MNDFVGTIMAAIVVILIMFGVWGIVVYIQKYKCESELPRNVSCVWTAPGQSDE